MLSGRSNQQLGNIGGQLVASPGRRCGSVISDADSDAMPIGTDGRMHPSIRRRLVVDAYEGLVSVKRLQSIVQIDPRFSLSLKHSFMLELSH